MRLFRYPVTILNTLDPLGKFDEKADEGFFVGYSINSKAFRVFNTRTRKVEENLHIKFLENKPNVAGSGPDWLFDIDLLTNYMNYKPVTAGNQTNKNAGIKDNVDAVSTQQYILLPLLYDSAQSSKDAVADNAGKKTNEEPANKAALDNLLVQQKKGYANSTNRDSIVSAVGQSFTNSDDLPTDPLMPDLEDIVDLLNIGIFSGAYDDKDVGAEADLNNLETTMNVIHALTDPSLIEAMQEELLQFKLQKVWTLVDLPKGKRAVGIKWVYINKKDERGIIVRNKARLVAQGYTQEEGIDYDKEVYVCQPPGFEDPQFPDKVYKVEKALYGLHQAPKAWYETLSTYLLENRFRRGLIDKTLFIKKSKGDILLVHIYVDGIIFGSIKKSLCIEFKSLMHKKFQMSSMGELTFFLGLQVMQRDDGIFISQDKYVADILKKFDFSLVKTASTPIETNKALLKDEEAEDVDVHLYRSMIGSLMYLTASRPDIMFVVCACARFQVTPKTSHLHAVKRIFRYLKGQPKLGLWYPRDSPFDLEAFSDSDYAGASLDRKSTTGGCQFLGKRLISWQCKKQTIVANSTTEAEYVAAANCCGQVLWIQNQMLDYGFNFMNTKIYIDNESTICIVKNPVFHSKTKHIKIRHNFIRDSYEKKLIQVIKIHTDQNVADLLTKAFDDLVLLGKNLKFDDQHNMIACLERTEENAEFHHIVDFLTSSSIHYALTQIHATVDGKTVVISESLIRSELYFNDEDGITCLTNTTIFETLALIGSKCTSWNEFSANIASAVIYLATGQKFNFSKLIFDEPFNDTYETPKHTKKVFTNMKRKGKDFSGRITPLFASMLAPPVVEGEGSGQPSEPQPPSSTTEPIIEEQILTSVTISNVADEAVFKERDDRVVRAITTAASLDATQASGVNKPRSDKERNKQQDLTNFIPPTPHDSPLSGGHTPGSNEGRPNINELMAICTNLSNRVLALEQSKTAQDLVINKLQKKVKRLEKALRARTLGMKLFKIGTSRRKGLDKENVSKQGRKSDKTKPMFKDSDFDVLDDAMENVEGGDIFEDEMTTIADTLVAIRSARPRTTSVVIRNVEEEPRRATPVPTVQSQDKGKGKMVEPEPTPKNPRKAQIHIDEELAQRLFEEEQAQFEREQRIAREIAAEQEAKDAALIEQMEDVQARMDADELLAARLQNKKENNFLLMNMLDSWWKPL
ncbi:putative ribonuclease H-like domain-containing protein [Tanacetum coccineum]